MKSQLDLFLAMLHDCSIALGFNSGMDEKTARRRFSNEGTSFVAVTLPSLDDLLCAGLSKGLLPTYIGWKPRSKSDRRPAFLHSLWSRVFDRSGRLLASPCTDAIHWVRQLSRSFKKTQELTDPRFFDAAVASFEETEQEIAALSEQLDVSTFQEWFRLIFWRDLSMADWSELAFKHGPGAVADKRDGVNKYTFDVIPDKLVDCVGAENFRATWYDLQNRPISSGSIPARLVAVPKTATKPRLISIEPAYNQFIQQGIKDKLYDLLEKYKWLSLSSQEPNRKLALKGSLAGDFATIDLSDASDRVSNLLVRGAFPSELDKLIQACRSEMLELPDSRVIALSKFASMGSALTFPIEVMVFCTIVVMAIADCESLPPLRSSVKKILAMECRVYGDDIIVPSQYASTVIQKLAAYGLKVNHLKSFTTGLFRESCGLDAYAGVDVTPVYVRQTLPESRRDVDKILSYVSLHNQYVERFGYGALSNEIESVIRSVVRPAFIPHGMDAGTSVSLWSHTSDESLHRGRYQRVEVSTFVPHYVRAIVEPEVDDNLFFKTLYEGFNEDEYHLTHRGRPTSATLKRRYVAVI